MVGVVVWRSVAAPGGHRREGFLPGADGNEMRWPENYQASKKSDGPATKDGKEPDAPVRRIDLAASLTVANHSVSAGW
jgi:hypothetical protein